MRTWGKAHKITHIQQSRELTDCRAEFDWLRASPRHALQQALRSLDNAFQRFFARLSDCPTPRKKGVNESFRLQEGLPHDLFKIVR